MIICSNTFHFFASQKCQVDPGGHVPRAGGRGVIFQREISVIFQRRRAASALLLVLLGLLGFWVSWFLGFLVSGFPGFWVPGFWVSCFLGIPTLNKETSHKHQINSKQTLNKS